MKDRSKTIHIVPHTHWDREWYLTFEQFRMNLVRLIDRLLEMMRDNEYRFFLLDGQTVVLEDYLEIRPERRVELIDLVQSGRISIGPWYVLPDLFLVSGESIIRNLQMGRKVAQEFGAPMPVGYMPDQFGFPSQMPQVLRGFGVKDAVVWRGFDDSLPMEIWWEAPDGSRVLAHRLDGKGGYLNAANLNLDSPEEATRQTMEIVDRLRPRVTSGQYLLMNGVDHRFPNANLPAAVRAINDAFDDATVSQSTLPAYFEAVRSRLSDMPVVRGEQRMSEKMEMLQGTLSTRMYLKQENERVETLLTYMAEPLCAFAHLLGAEYPHSLLDYAWKQLLKNHAHDSICGCSLDEVHSEMMTRFASARQVAEMLSEHATKRIADALSDDPEQSQCLMVTNTMPWERTELVDTEIILPKEDTWESFHLMDGDVEIPYTIISKDEGAVEFDAAAALDSFPAFKSGCKYRILFLVESVPGWGYRLLRIQSGAGSAVTKSLISDFVTDGGLPGAETESVRLEFNEDGTFNLEDLRSGNSFQGMHFFEDSGDCGDEYNYCPPRDDQKITSIGCKARISLEASGCAFRTFRVEQSLEVPEHIVRDPVTSRSEELCRIGIVSHITIAAKVSRVDIVTEVFNTACDHRLRVMLPTDVRTDKSFAETAFDIVEREITAPEHDGWMEDPLTTYPQLNFAGAASNERTLAIANRGLTEYELSTDDRRTFALTLLRCVEWGSRGDLTNTRRGHKEDGSVGHNYLFTPEAQCQGRHEFHYSIITGVGDPINSGVARQAYNHKVGLIGHQRKLSDQVSSIGRFMECDMLDSVICSALKVSDGEERLVARFVNLSREDAEVEFGRAQAIKSVWESDLAERLITRLDSTENPDQLEVSLPAKTILTLGLDINGAHPDD